ncbi:MAG: hypothetical protein PHX44_01975 [Sulfurimonas sp.]|uniref:hypothetical protein n=1 Tax=Sulfurimonas sp. TaxID=2022749 RepID=UPI0026373F3D|nr:hypothetical protein [Sulfurimonas sp.]MDD2651802.1 hypothetical protein [Sulfurimonas sp.]MDD3451646.1 hypothetical protein [Sulfurimonas sp.]
MNGSLKSLFFISALTSGAALLADENLQVKASTVSQMFEEGKVSGNIRAIYAGYNQKQLGEDDVYATALGGYLKYELSELDGFSAAAAFAVSHDLGFATGERGSKQNDELSSSNGEYNTLSEAYLNYSYNDFNFRAGRQLIDTPLADSDDIRMIQNTFEAYIATYETLNFNFMAGKLEKWQGTDAGLDNGWVKTGEDGTLFGGITYSKDTMEANAWYYNISKLTDATYLDAKFGYEISDDLSILGAVQYLRENEIDNSGTKASVYGLLAEVSAYGFTLNAAYNNSQKESGKASFSGFGGGALFTSMDSMILDAITMDRGAKAVVAGFTYNYNNLKLMYAYGDFKGNANSLGAKEHIIEQNIGCEYTLQKELMLAVVYVKDRDKEHSYSNGGNWENMRVLLSYNF